MRPLVLDTGALIALERRDPRMVALADEIVQARLPAYTPAGVVAQAWRGSPRQHPLIRLMRSRLIQVEPLTEEVAYEIGVMLAATRTSDVVDAHVALLAGRVRGAVVTSDPADIGALDPGLVVLAI